MITQTKKLQVKPKKTYVCNILDESGSMSMVRDSTITAFNEQLEQHRIDAVGEVYLSLYKFNGNVSEVFFNSPLEDISGNLDHSQYSPAGGTALLDGIGTAISKLQRFDEEGDTAFLILIHSDGADNASKKYDYKKISSLIKELEETGRWTFQYLGCDDNAIKEAQALGLKSAVFHKTDTGILNNSTNVRNSVKNFYSMRSDGTTAYAANASFYTEAAPDFDPLQKLSDTLNPKR